MQTSPPLHRPAATTTPKDFFLHLLAIVMLYVTVISVITLLFQYVNVLFPDVLAYDSRTGMFDTIRWSTASLLVVFPVYLFCSWLLQRDITAEPEKANLRVRRWLIHFTLFVAALTIIIDLMTLIYYFLNGDLTPRFLLKVGVVLITAGTVFGYYLWELRVTDHRGSRTTRVAVAAVVSFVLLAGIVAGFFIAGTPTYQRLVRLDERRVSDLDTLQSQITNTWQLKRALPTQLSELNNPLSNFTVPTDPDSAASYEYSVKGPLAFELCATFATATSAMEKSAKTNPYGTNQNWWHETGRQCFQRTIDPDLYPNPQKLPPPVPVSELNR